MPRSLFTNPWPHEQHGVIDVLKWKLRLIPTEKPQIPEATNWPAVWRRVTGEDIQTPPAEGWRVVWLGHSSFLVQGMGVSLLVDPVFSEFCSPWPIASLRRKVAPPCSIDDLPKIHAVLLTHSHYDHMDIATLKALGDRTRLIVPKGHAEFLTEKNLFRFVSELDWYEEEFIVAGVTVKAMPAQHFTARTPFDRNMGHWCGWLLEGGGCKLWHAGDSGYCPAFQEIGERYGPIDLAMIPIGAYQPRSIMKPMHMNPEEAVQVFEDARCRRAIAMHWGTFSLTDEPVQEPPMRLRAELERRRIPQDHFVAGKVGQIWQVQPLQQAE